MKKIAHIFSNRNIAIVLTLAFGVWVIFFDKNNYLDSKDLDAKINTLKQEADYYRRQIAEDSTVIAGLQDSAFLERFAREKYRMKRDNEILYILKQD